MDYRTVLESHSYMHTTHLNSNLILVIRLSISVIKNTIVFHNGIAMSIDSTITKNIIPKMSSVIPMK